MTQFSSSYRRDSLNQHPPYGLFLDPHRGQHTWTAASARVLLAILALLAAVLAIYLFGPH
jgi:hypothetical protein